MAKQKQSGPAGGIYFSKGKIVYAMQGFGSSITGTPEKPALYGPDDEPGTNYMRYSKGGTGGGGSSINVAKFSSKKKGKK